MNLFKEMLLCLRWSFPKSIKGLPQWGNYKNNRIELETKKEKKKRKRFSLGR